MRRGAPVLDKVKNKGEPWDMQIRAALADEPGRLGSDSDWSDLGCRVRALSRGASDSEAMS